MFHSFTVVRGEKTCQSIARITNTAHIIGACGIEWDSLPEVGGRRKQQHITTTNTSHVTRRCAWACVTNSPVMFHAFPVVRGEKTCQSIARITNTAYIIGACGIEWDSQTAEGGRKEKAATYNNYKHITLSLEDVHGHVLLTHLLCSVSSQ